MMSSLTIGDEVITNSYEIENKFIDYFNSIFRVDNNCYNNGLIEDVIPNIVNDQMNSMLTSYSHSHLSA